MNQTNVNGSTPPSSQGNDETLNSSPTFVNDLNDIISGKFDADTDKIDALLDQTAAQAEEAGLFAEYENLFNQAADHLTELLKEKAAKI